jgi:hypothetical protein
VGNFKIQVPVIVGSNTAQVLVVTEIPLSPPAFKIDEIDKLIEIDDSFSGQVGESVAGSKVLCGSWSGKRWSN